MVGKMLKCEKLLLAAKKCPYYSQTSYNITTFDDCPIITKEIVSHEHSLFISEGANDENLLVVSTSGSTGTPLKILWSPLDYCNSLAELWKIRKEFGVYPNDKFVSCHAMFYNGTLGIHNRAIIQKNNLSLSKISLSKLNFAYYYDLLISFKPKFMMLSPSFLFSFVTYLNGENLKLPQSIKLIELTGEHCSEELFLWFKERYPLINWKIMYGMQEFNGIAYGSTDGLSILKNNVFVEIVNEKGCPVETNEEGNIIVTGLKNLVFPLVRYRTEDKGFWDANGMLHITKSRSNDYFNYQGVEFDGSIVWAVVFYLQQQLDISILQFQVRYKHNKFHFLLILNDNALCSNEILIDCISKFLIEKYQINAEVIIDIVQHIAIEQGKNKIKYFVNENNLIEEDNTNEKQE